MSYHESSNEDKVYRFISDPKHKENLSGRVRAACITCRRKKIKCDGEVPCKTCEEKGLVCEGLTERKRPKAKMDARRSSDLSTHTVRNGSPVSSPEFAKPEYSQKAVPLQISHPGGSPSNALQRPTLENLNFTSSDSGYASGRQSSPRVSKAEDTARFEAVDPTLAAYESSNNVSPTDARPCDWNLVVGKDGCNYTEPDVVRRGDVLPESASAESVSWLDPASQNTAWWPHNTSVSAHATNLISTARLLEEQAQSLRRLASGQTATAANDSRRQTITLPLTDRFNVTPPYPPDAFDDLALLLTARTPDSRLMPSAPELTSWMSVDSNYSNPLDFQHTVGSLAQQPGVTRMQVPEHGTSGWNQSLNQDNYSSSTLSTQAHQLHPEPVRVLGDYPPVDKSAPSPFTDHYGQLHHWPE